MKIKLNRNQILVLIIAFIFVFYSLIQSVFKFNISRKLVDQVSFVLLIGAFILLFAGKKKSKEKAPIAKKVRNESMSVNNLEAENREETRNEDEKDNNQ